MRWGFFWEFFETFWRTRPEWYEPRGIGLHGPRPDQWQGQICHVLETRRSPVTQEQVVPDQQQQVAGKDSDKGFADPLANVYVRIVECRKILVLKNCLFTFCTGRHMFVYSKMPKKIEQTLPSTAFSFLSQSKSFSTLLSLCEGSRKRSCECLHCYGSLLIPPPKTCDILGLKWRINCNYYNYSWR